MAEPTFDQNKFWDNWEKTKLGNLRNLSRKEIQDYYDEFSVAHYTLTPDTGRDWYVAAEDRMASLQSELEFRRNRDLQIVVASIGAVVLFLVAIFEHNKPCNENANIEHPKTQISPAPTESNRQPSP